GATPGAVTRSRTSTTVLWPGGCTRPRWSSRGRTIRRLRRATATDSPGCSPTPAARWSAEPRTWPTWNARTWSTTCCCGTWPRPRSPGPEVAAPSGTAARTARRSQQRLVEFQQVAVGIPEVRRADAERGPLLDRGDQGNARRGQFGGLGVHVVHLEDHRDPVLPGQVRVLHVGLQRLGDHLALVERELGVGPRLELGVAGVLGPPQHGEFQHVGVEAETRLVVVCQKPDIAHSHGVPPPEPPDGSSHHILPFRWERSKTPNHSRTFP